MPFSTPTKASALSSRGLMSHTPIFHPPPFRPVTPSPLRTRPTFDDSPDTLPYKPTPIRTPIFSPIRSPFSPVAPFPRTPSTPPFIVSPILARVGARERRRELRRAAKSSSLLPPSVASPTPASKGAREQRRESRLGADPTTPPPKPLHVLASVGARGARELRRELRREATPGACDRVMMLLPAKWCAHKVAPSSMKDGMRVVRITVPKGQKSTAPAAKKEAKKIATPPPVETKPLKRHVLSPVVEAGPEPVSSATPDAHSATHTHSPPQAHSETHDHCDVPHTPFRNPDLNDQPLHWSPSMFRSSPKFDRHNWTWSDWDSPSWVWEDVTYQSEDGPVRDPLARLPPLLRAKIKAVLALKPDWSPPPTTADPTSDSLTADTVRYEEADFMSSFSSNNSSPLKKPAPPKQPTRSQSPDSSWVIIDEEPWPTWLLEMRLDDSRFNPLKERIVLPEFSPLSSRSASILEILSVPRPSAPVPPSSSSPIPSPSVSYPPAPAPAPSPVVTSPSVPPASNSDASIPSQPSGSSSSVDVDPPKSSNDYLGVLQQAEEKLREREAQRAHTGTRDRLSDDTQDSFGSDLSLSGLSSGSGTSTPSESVSAILRRLNSAPDSNSGASTPLETTGDILQHFRSFSRPSSPAPPAAVEGPPTFIPEAFTAPVRLSTPPPPPPTPRHFYTMRQLPSASAMEPCKPVEEPPRGAGFGWKSLACVAVGAAAVGAGLAYAWFSS